MGPRDAQRETDGGGRPVFRRRHRIRGEEAFAAVFEARLRKSRGPITVFLRPNGLPEHRLGLSIGRRFGSAVRRNRFKRLMREAFRRRRSGLPVAAGGGGYDIVVTARGHEDLGLERSTELFCEAVEAAHRVHVRRDGS